MSALTAADAFPAADLERHRRDLLGYCYRMLGSVHEAEDAVQDTMLRAWRALATFEDREGLRPWLYRIATNVCIDMLKGRSRRALPMHLVPAASGEARFGEPRPEATWIQPAPDSLILAPDDDPAERALSRESVRIAFIAALQHLAPRQRAVLILRDVLRWRAAEVAALLGTSADAVNSALRRARTALTAVDPEAAPTEPAGGDRELLAAYVSAFEHHDVDALVALLRHDAIVDMPPYELWLTGREEIRQWLIAHDALSDHVLIPVEANGSPAAAVYRPLAPGDPASAFAVHVLDTAAGRIRAIHSFIDPALFDLFDLPPVLQPATPEAGHRSVMNSSQHEGRKG